MQELLQKSKQAFQKQEEFPSPEAQEAYDKFNRVRKNLRINLNKLEKEQNEYVNKGPLSAVEKEIKENLKLFQKILIVIPTRLNEKKKKEILEEIDGAKFVLIQLAITLEIEFQRLKADQALFRTNPTKPVVRPKKPKQAVVRRKSNASQVNQDLVVAPSPEKEEEEKSTKKQKKVKREQFHFSEHLCSLFQNFIGKFRLLPYFEKRQRWQNIVSYYFSGSGSAELDQEIISFIKTKFILCTTSLILEDQIALESIKNQPIKSVLQPFSSEVKYSVQNKQIELVGTNQQVLKIAKQHIARFYLEQAPQQYSLKISMQEALILQFLTASLPGSRAIKILDFDLHLIREHGQSFSLKFRCAALQKEQKIDKIKKMISDICVEEFIITDTVEEMLTLRHPTQHHLEFIKVVALKKKCNYALNKINEFQQSFGMNQNYANEGTYEEVKEKQSAHYKKLFLEDGNGQFCHELKVVALNKKALSSFQSQIQKYLREMKKKVGFLELSQYQSSESETNKESEESLEVRYQSNSKEWKQIYKRLSYQRIKTEETLSFSKQFNVVIEVAEKEECLLISIYSNSRSAQKLAMAELSLRFKLQNVVKLDLPLKKAAWNMFNSQKCKEIEDEIHEKIPSHRFYFKHAKQAKDAHGVLLCDDKTLNDKSTQYQAVNIAKLVINQKLKEIKMMVLSSSYWNFRHDFQQIKAALGVKLVIHQNNSPNPLQFTQSAKQYETYWKQKDQDLWRSYTSNFNPKKRDEKKEEKKAPEQIRVLGTKECLLIGLEDQVEKFSSQLQKMLGEQPQRKFPFLKYQSVVAQRVEDKRNCIIQPIEGGGIIIKGREHYDAFLDYTTLFSETKELPPYWDQSQDNCLVEVGKKSSEFKEVKSTFLKGLQNSESEYQVVRIERVQSSHLWDQFSREKFLLSCHQFYREIDVYQTQDGLFSLLDFSGVEIPDTPRQSSDSRVFAQNPRIYDHKLKTTPRVQILFKALVGEVHSQNLKTKGSIVPLSADQETIQISTKKGNKYRIFVQSRAYPAYRISYKLKSD